MPQLGESVTEGTVTRWLKREGEHVQADEPLLEVSTDKVDTEIPSPVSGVLRGITVAEDETVAVGAELAVIDEDGSAAAEQATASAQAAPAPAAAPQAPPTQAPPTQAPPTQAPPAAAEYAPAAAAPPPAAAPSAAPPAYQPPAYQQPAASYQPPAAPPPAAPAPPAPAPAAPVSADLPPTAEEPPPTYQAPAAAYQATGYEEPGNGQAAAPGQFAEAADGPYVTPLVRKLASEHGIDLATVTGTGVGGRIRKQDILDAAALARGAAGQPAAAASPSAAPPSAAEPAPAPAAQPAVAPPVPQPPSGAPGAYPAVAPAAAPPGPPTAAPSFTPTAAGEAEGRPRPAIVPSRLRGTTERMSRARQVIAQRMVESLQTSAQLTTVVEADVTAIARLRDRAKAAFEAREGVKLSFLPFFALAAVEALKVHPKLNAVIDTASAQVTYHDAEHLGIAVDTERGLMVPVIKNAGDLNIGGLARKIADLAERTRAGQVSPDDLSGGTFTLTNTGSRGALFDTPIINQPQVGILGTGTVVKRAVVVEDPALGEVITVRSMVYLALTYDHRLVDGADAARFLLTVKERLEEGAFETELGL
jgi:pyruvate dehydrogenase E2 component (dihydrolipoamide acetyltransferase)